jgi:GntR family transcriptional regulator
MEAGDQLPSEKQLGNKFDVSRVTIRHALKTLDNEGLIYRRQGLGSFVSDIELRQPLVCLTDFSEDMHRAGLTARSSVISQEVVTCTPPVCRKLDLDEGSSVLRLDRLRLGDDLPIAFDITWMPMFYGQLLDGHNLEEETIYTILENEYDIAILRGHYKIKAANASDYVARHLDIVPGAALLVINRISLTVGEKKVYYQERYYRTDRINYEIQLERRDMETDCSKEGMPLKQFAPNFFDKD